MVYLELFSRGFVALLRADIKELFLMVSPLTGFQLHQVCLKDQYLALYCLLFMLMMLQTTSNPNQHLLFFPMTLNYTNPSTPLPQSTFFNKILINYTNGVLTGQWILINLNVKPFVFLARKERVMPIIGWAFNQLNLSLILVLS